MIERVSPFGFAREFVTRWDALAIIVVVGLLVFFAEAGLGFISVTVAFLMSLAPGRVLGAEFAAVFAIFFRPLVAWIDRFRIEQEPGVRAPQSWVLTMLVRSRLIRLATQGLRTLIRWTTRTTTRAQATHSRTRRWMSARRSLRGSSRATCLSQRTFAAFWTTAPRTLRR